VKKNFKSAVFRILRAARQDLKTAGEREEAVWSNKSGRPKKLAGLSDRE
jgi:hypothetical protein